MKAFIITLIACLTFSIGNAQKLPKVFLLGEHEKGFDELTKEHTNSRNLDQDKLKLFLISFMNQYNLPISYNKNFSHYGSASFPMTVVHRSESDTKKKQTGALARENEISSGNDDK